MSTINNPVVATWVKHDIRNAMRADGTVWQLYYDGWRCTDCRALPDTTPAPAEAKETISGDGCRIINLEREEIASCVERGAVSFYGVKLEMDDDSRLLVSPRTDTYPPEVQALIVDARMSVQHMNDGCGRHLTNESIIRRLAKLGDTP